MHSIRFHRPSRRRALRSVPALLAIVATALGMAAAARADEAGWPRQFDTSGGAFTMYQPQPEQLNGDVLTGRAAFSVQKAGDPNPLFGVLWFKERIEIDRDSSTVHARNLD